MIAIRLIVVVMICLYLHHPSRGVAATFFDPPRIFQSDKSESPSAGHLPCSDCPCSDTTHGDCSFNCSCCSFIPSLTHHFSGIIYPPAEQKLAIAEPYRRLPQVYLPIFVPPQNKA